MSENSLDGRISSAFPLTRTRFEYFLFRCVSIFCRLVDEWGAVLPSTTYTSDKVGEEGDCDGVARFRNGFLTVLSKKCYALLEQGRSGFARGLWHCLRSDWGFIELRRSIRELAPGTVGL